MAAFILSVFFSCWSLNFISNTWRKERALSQGKKKTRIPVLGCLLRKFWRLSAGLKKCSRTWNNRGDKLFFFVLYSYKVNLIKKNQTSGPLQKKDEVLIMNNWKTRGATICKLCPHMHTENNSWHTYFTLE